MLGCLRRRDDPDTADAHRRAGDCLSACLASILEVPIQTVPDFIDAPDFEAAINSWLAERGLTYTQVPIDNPAPVGWHTVEGASPRGGQHAVVGRDGTVVFDPHPEDGTGRGLRTPQRYGILEPLGRAEDEFFRPGGSVRYACEHCGKPLTAYRDGMQRDPNGVGVCLRSPTRKHEPTEVPYQGVKRGGK